MQRSIITPLTHCLVAFTLLAGCARAQVPAGTMPADSVVVRIETVPNRAFLAVGGASLGVTPFRLHAKRGDTLALWLSATGFSDWRATYVPGVADSSHLFVRLERADPTISVVVDPPNSAVILDGKRVAQGAVFGHVTEFGDHHLVVVNDSLGRRADMKLSFTEAQRYFFSARLGSVREGRVAGAFLLPGSVHLLDGEYMTGSLMLVGTIALGYFAFSELSDYGSCRDRYDRAMAEYLVAPTDAQATRLHQDVADAKSELDRAYTRKIVALSLFVGGYVYSVIDGLLHHALGDVVRVVPPREIPGLPFPSDDGRVQARITF